MNIKQIETFVRIVELGSFQAAASVLCASPSTVSARIKELERHLGTELFDRSFHRAQPTARGQAFYEHARRLVEFTSALARDMRAPQAMTGLLRLGVVGVVANTWLPRLVAALRNTCPGVTLRIDANLTRLLLERLGEGRLDLAIVAGEVADPALHGVPLGTDRFVWMSGPGGPQPPADGRALSPRELARHPILALTEDSHHHLIVKHWFRDGGVALAPATSCNSMNVLAELTSRGLGTSLLPRHAYRSELAAGRLVELPTTPDLPAVSFSLVHHRERVPPLADTVAALAQVASDLPSAVT
ncbi:LysR family transcriptional regulator [Piscinibacter sakaiensis]|uniref:Transcriptional regulator, LysR family n=1 Tax=Piscinibacter sakaiensis TaxID=1547922 RepID=A0A0K8NYE4_PISS1|nr:LysR family transcriptional regulator [Piscinibacter sakaiensis]GAP35393.1 transcriptional regulator, LysR family [Piscinibacter sakaiensis]